MKNELLLELGAKIRLERMKRKMSQEHLAELANLSTSSLSEIECGKSNPGYLTLVGIAHALDLKPAQMLDFKF